MASTLPRPQDWGEFCKLAAETIGLLDQGQIGEAEALERLRPGTLYNTLREAILLRHRPEAIRPLMRLRRLPGESEEAAQERWRDVSVRRRSLLLRCCWGCSTIALPVWAALALRALPLGLRSRS